MKNVIVTGANGFIGSSLIKRLVENGIRVVAIDINFNNSNLPDTDSIIKITATIDRNLTDVIPSADYDALYHFAWRGINGTEKANPDIQLANIQMALVCADICRQLNISKLLCAGTVAENAVQSLSHLSHTNGGMIYGAAKHACHLILETYCKNIGVSCVWMQFSNIYGVGNRTGNLVSYTLSEILADKTATFGPALQPYDFIYIDDLVEAVYRLGEKTTHKSTYFIGSGSPHVLKEYLYKIGDITGKRDKIVIGVRPDDGIRYDYSMFCADDLKCDIGDYVSVPFEDGINKTVEWFNSSQL